jgi:hypothetical protein
VTISSARPGIPPFGPGTGLTIQCGPNERPELMLTGPANRWLLHTLRYQNGRDREFMTGSGWYTTDTRPGIPSKAADLCDRLVAAQAEARAAGNREAARLAAAGAHPRVADVTYGQWRGCRLTLAVQGGAAVFAYTRGCWDLLLGPSGKARPAPLDPWLDVTGGFSVMEGPTHEALTGHLIVALRSHEAAAPQQAGPAGTGRPGRHLPEEPGR